MLDGTKNDWAAPDQDDSVCTLLTAPLQERTIAISDELSDPSCAGFLSKFIVHREEFL